MTGLQVDDDRVAPPGRRGGWAIASIAVCQLMLMVDGVIVTVALPPIREEFGFDAAGLSWVVTAYALAFAGLLLVSGRIGTLVGPRRTLLIGVSVFVLASAAGGMAPTGELLVAARAVQGAGAALAGPAVLVLLFANTDEGPARVRAMSLFVMASSVGSAVGLIAGGILTVTAGWRWVMLVNVPIGALILAGMLLFVREAPRGHGRLDVGGALVSVVAMLALVVALNHAAAAGWSDAVTLLSFAVAAVALASFVLVERTVRHPVIPGRLLAGARLWSPYLGMLLMPAAMIGFFYFATLLFQDVLGFDALLTGLAFLPFTAAVFVGGRLAPAVLARLGERGTALLAVVLAGVGVAGFGLLAPHHPYWVGSLVPSFVLGFGPPLFFTIANTRIMQNAEAEDSGSAASLLQSLQQLGGALGVATLTTVYAHAAPAGTTAAISAAVLASTGFVVLLAVVVVATPAFARRVREPALPTPARASS